MLETGTTQLGRRILVVGTTGSGKTTLASRLAARIGARQIELDALHWEPNWTKAEMPVFLERLEKALDCDSWVVDGNYGMVRHILWSRADMLVWLDYSLPRIMWQLTRRTIRRMVTREKLWGTNQESFRLTFLSKDSILLWALTSYRKHQRDYPGLFARPEYSHLAVVRLTSPGEMRRWLSSVSCLESVLRT